jgi:putative tryptophan/tyrosine transport system substrate-binding protein
MRRRELLLMASVVMGARGLRAQQKAMPVIGLLDALSPEGHTEQLDAFRQGLGEAGYVDGRNVAVEYRSAQDPYDRLPALAANLIALHVAVIAAPSLPAALAAKAATATVPVVFNTGVDAVEAGLVESFNRPGGNFTGVSLLMAEMVPKQLEILHELVPKTAVFGLLVNPKGAVTNRHSQLAMEASRAIGQQLIIVEASSETELETSFATLVEQRVGGLVVAADPFFAGHRNLLAGLAARYAVPTIYNGYTYVTAGGLISYGSNPTWTYRQVGLYVGRILDGAMPADLPVIRPDRFELVINLKTAEALGLTIPPSILARADQVIE